MNTIRAYIEAAKAAAAEQSAAPKPIPPRPQTRAHAMPGPIASVALRVVQELLLTLVTKGVLTVDEADGIFDRSDKATGGQQQSSYVISDAKGQIAWNLMYGGPREPQSNGKPTKAGSKISAPATTQLAGWPSGR